MVMVFGMIVKYFGINIKLKWFFNGLSGLPEGRPEAKTGTAGKNGDGGCT